MSIAYKASSDIVYKEGSFENGPRGMAIIVDMPGLQVNTSKAKPNGLIDPWPFRAKDLIVLVSSSLSDRKGNNKVGKCKLKIFVWE